MKYIGKEMSRVDGTAKVTGKAKYATEFAIKNVAYGFIVQSTIAKGTIKSMNVADAEKQTGVIKIFTHFNSTKTQSKAAAFCALQNDKIVFNGQPIALVVAETFEQARFAARLIKVEYTAETHLTEAEKATPIDSRSLKTRGNPQEALANSEVKIEPIIRFPSNTTIRSNRTAQLLHGKATNY